MGSISVLYIQGSHMRPMSNLGRFHFAFSGTYMCPISHRWLIWVHDYLPQEQLQKDAHIWPSPDIAYRSQMSILLFAVIIWTHLGSIWARPYRLFQIQPRYHGFLRKWDPYELAQIQPIYPCVRPMYQCFLGIGVSNRVDSICGAIYDMEEGDILTDSPPIANYLCLLLLT